MRRFLKFTHEIKKNDKGDACSMNEGEVYIAFC
jgi:hypothetical protein